MKQGLYKSSPNKVIEIDTFTGKKGSEIEELIPAELIVDSFDPLFKGEDGIEVGDINTKKPIIPQLKKSAKEHRISLELGWKVELGKKSKAKI